MLKFFKVCKISWNFVLFFSNPQKVELDIGSYIIKQILLKKLNLMYLKANGNQEFELLIRLQEEIFGGYVSVFPSLLNTIISGLKNSLYS